MAQPPSKPQARPQATRPTQPEPQRQSVADRYSVTSVWAHLAMCAATAVLLTLAFPLPGWSFMAWFALVPVGVLAMRTRKLWTLAWTSYLVFFAWWALRVMWLKHVQPAAPFAMASVCALYFTLCLVALAAVQRRYKGAMTLTLPIFWCAQEIIRSVFPVGGFAWFTLAASQAAWRPGQHPGYLVQSADLFGWVTVSFLVAMTSGLLVDLIARPLTKRRESGGVRPRRTIVTAVLLWGGCIGGALLYGHQRLAGAPVVGEAGVRSVVLGIVQTNVPQSNKREGNEAERIAQRREDFDRLIELSKASAADEPRPDLILWPETVVVRPINDEAADLAAAGAYNPAVAEEILYYRDTVQQHADTTRIPLVVGSQARGFASHDRSMNSALYVLPGAATWPRYSKMHRVPMGEYIPGPPWVQDLFLKHISPYDYDYTVQPGEGIVIFETEVAAPPAMSVDTVPVRFATPICYEDAVADQCRKMVYGSTGQKRVDLLLNLTNDGWYPGSHQGFQHLQIAAVRCIENRVPMARSVNTGVSGLIDSSGRVGPLVMTGGQVQEVEGHVNVEVALDPRSTLYGRLRESVWVGVCLSAGLLLLGVLVPRRFGRGATGR